MKIIKSINCNQHEIIRDILNLHNSGNQIDCDITYSKGNFYGDSKDNDGRVFTIAEPNYKFDVAPQFEDVKQLDKWGMIPLENDSINCIMIDLPFVITSINAPSIRKNDSSNIIVKRFSGYNNQDELFESYRHWISEAYRVLREDGILIFKCQPTINSNTQLMTNLYSCNIAESIGFYILDEFILLAKSRLIGRVYQQQHSRKYHSYFYVFKKNSKLRDKVYYNKKR